MSTLKDAVHNHSLVIAKVNHKLDSVAGTLLKIDEAFEKIKAPLLPFKAYIESVTYNNKSARIISFPPKDSGFGVFREAGGKKSFFVSLEYGPKIVIHQDHKGNLVVLLHDPYIENITTEQSEVISTFAPNLFHESMVEKWLTQAVESYSKMFSDNI